MGGRARWRLRRRPRAARPDANPRCGPQPVGRLRLPSAAAPSFSPRPRRSGRPGGRRGRNWGWGWCWASRGSPRTSPQTEPLLASGPRRHRQTGLETSCLPGSLPHSCRRRQRKKSAWATRVEGVSITKRGARPSQHAAGGQACDLGAIVCCSLRWGRGVSSSSPLLSPGDVFFRTCDGATVNAFPTPPPSALPPPHTPPPCHGQNVRARGDPRHRVGIAVLPLDVNESFFTRADPKLLENSAGLYSLSIRRHEGR